MSLQPDPRQLVGRVIADKYAIEALVGEGGFGVVFRARHEIWDQPVALKCFTALSNAPVELRDELLDKFVQEGKLLGALSSHTAAIVQARDIGTLTTPDGFWLPYMVLEWLEGRSLDHFLRAEQGQGRRRDPLEAFRILDGVARGLALAHNHGIAHRDIKPANFFVCGTALAPGVVIKLLDFGIAKVMQSRTSDTARAAQSGVMSFTPNYGAPEQFDRSHGETGPWTDVYGMALVMLEIMTGGARALPGDNLMQLAYATQNEVRRPTPRTLGLEVSDAVEEVFRRATAIKALQRYPDMTTFWFELVRALDIRDYPPIERGVLALSSRRGRGATTLRGSRRLAESGPHAARGERTGPHISAGRERVDQTGKTIAYGHDATETVDPDASADEPEDDLVAPAPAPAASRRRPVIMAVGSAAIAAVIGGAIVYSARAPDEASAPATVGADAPATAPDAPPPPAADATAPEVAPEEPAPPPPPPWPEGMVFIEGGKFFMGTDADKPVLKLAVPAHKVEVGSFCMDVLEVTAGEYRACSDEGECKRAHKDSFWPQGSTKQREWDEQRAAYSELCTGFAPELETHPINCVTWEQADEYCRVHKRRLPTEAEWEYAARGSDGRIYPWGDALPSPAHLNGCGPECTAWREAKGLGGHPVIYEQADDYVGTAPVGSFPAGKTQGGLLDMVGNVFEWTADEFHPYPDKDADPEAQPERVPTHNRVIRGGAFNSFMPEFTDPALRFPLDADAHSHGVGFRCARDPAGA